MMVSRKSGLMALMVVFLSVSAHAGVIYSTGFETTDGFSVGTIAGQNGWSIFNSGSSVDNIEDSFPPPFAGTQAAGVLPSGTLQSGIFRTDTATGPLIDLNTEIYIASTGLSQESDWQFAATGEVSLLTPFIGGINIVPDTGSVDAIDAITSGGPAIGSFTLNSWHDVDLLFNFTTQTYTISLDGTVLASNLAFCGDNSVCAGEAVTEGAFSSFFDVFATANSNDLGAIDNLSLSSVAPEPATYGLTGIALLAGALLRRRRR
jgi:hypothetical protein